MRKLAWGLLLTTALGAVEAHAATTITGPVQPYSAVSHQWLTSLSTNGAFSSTQPAVGDLANVGAGTVLGNATGSSAAPTATSAPVLGVGGTTAGTLGLANGGASGAVITFQNLGATAAYNFNLPTGAGTAGQVLTSQGGGSTSMTWSTVLTAARTISSKTANYTVTSADDSKHFDNAGAGGAVNFTLPASPAAGDDWCFLVAAAQSLTVTANTGQTISIGPNTSASAGNITSSTVGSLACIYYESTTAAYAESFVGPWTIN